MATTARLELIKISDIDRTGRNRRDLGELRPLCQSIAKIGLLHPVVITAKHKLVAGARRIAAYERNGETKIPAYIVTNLKDAAMLLQAEQDENTCRKDFTPSEAVEIGKALEPLEKAEAKERQKLSEGRGKKREGNFPNLNMGRSGDKVAAAVGMSGRSYSAAKTVIAAAEESPEDFGDIAKEMDATGKVWPAYKKVRDIKKSGNRAEANSPQPANGRLPVGIIRANEAIDCLKRIPKNDIHRKRGFQIVSDWIRHNR